MSRVNQYEVTLRVDGTDYGVYDSFSGGGTDSEESKYRPGGMQPQVSLGGSQTTDNIVIGRLFRGDRDALQVKQLTARCGKGQCVVVKQLLTVDGDAVAEPLTYTGTLKRCTPPDHDSESDDPGRLELEITPDGPPS